MSNYLIYSMVVAALVVSDVLLIVLGIYCYRLYNRSPERDTHTDAVQQDLQQDLKVLNVSMSVLGERLTRLESQMNRLQQEWGERQASLGSQETDHKAIKVATKMALQGAGVEELVTLCGLTRGEAELIRMLHANIEQGDR